MFSPEERALLARHFTNADEPVFALVNAPSARRFRLTNPDRYSLTYNGVVLVAEKRRSQGWHAFASYTFSKSIDESAGQYNSFASTERSSAIDPDDRNREQGLSNFDVRHNLVINWNYDLPGRDKKFIGGWALSGIATVSGGSPFSARP